MTRKTRLMMAALALFLAITANASADEGAAGFARQGAVGTAGMSQAAGTPAYGSYVYNYPHAIPPDYVYRTARVFSPRTTDPGSSPDVPAGSGRALAGKVGDLGKALLHNAREEIVGEYAVLVSTFVNLNNLYATSSMGRYLSEQLIGELQRAGVDVIEMRKSPGVLISQGFGEYSLSRDMDELRFVQPAQATVVGTYTVADKEIFLNVRVLRNSDNMILSTADTVLGMDGITRQMLADEAMPSGAGAPVSLRAFSR